MTATYPPAFTPEATNAMGEAFDLACHVLGEVPPAVKENIANRVIREAAAGERDLERLLLAGLKGMSV